MDALGLDVEDARRRFPLDRGRARPPRRRPAPRSSPSGSPRTSAAASPSDSSRGRRIQKDAALQQRAVHVGDHRPDVAAGVPARCAPNPGTAGCPPGTSADSPRSPSRSCRRRESARRWPRARTIQSTGRARTCPRHGRWSARTRWTNRTECSRRRPGSCRAGRSVSTAPGIVGSFLRMEKIVPTPTQTSRFDEPSSGSKTTQYLPPSTPRLRIVGSSSSSEATTASVGRLPRHLVRMSLAITSSFCWVSPWTLAPPSSPSTSSMRARRTLAAIAFAGERDRRQDPREITGRAGIARLLLKNVRLQRRDVHGASGGQDNTLRIV